MATDFITLTNVVQMVVSGLLLGGVYALVGLGLTLAFGVMKIINMAHGEFLMLGGYLTFWLFTLANLNPLLSLPISMVALFGLGGLLQHTIVRRVVGKPELTSKLLTFGIGIAIVGFALTAWSSDYRSVPYLSTAVDVGGVRLSTTRLLAFAVAMATSGAFYAFLRFTRGGHAIRATAQLRELALVCGINVWRVHVIAFGLSASLAAIGGSLLSMMFTIYPEMGITFTIKAFAIIIMGGAGNFLGAFLAAMLLGVAETVGSLFVTAQAVEAIAFILLIGTLLVRPTGLFFGERE
ncbi:MAG: branched-chain amino acid ABC transporter permease [Candidatus Rokubacteria bacterium]|nr:branched-chain amino acid ABC transporter permease [Candidatus Rokubacteria bacterium]